MILKYLSRLIIGIIGWKIKMVLPPEKKYVVVVAPHTSNWDLIIAKLANWSCGQKVKVLVKKEAFSFFLGSIIRMWGGIPVDRNNTSSIVDQVVQYFHDNEEFVLGITPEGTRQSNPNWKTGFYRIAMKANVPIYLAYVDFSKKHGGMHDKFIPTGSMERDMEEIKQYYSGMRGYHPDRFKVDEV